MARNVPKDDLEAQREALSSHGYSAYSSSGSKTPRRIMSVSQPVKVISSRASDSRLDTVLARLLLAARPADPARLGAVDGHHRHLVAVPPRSPG